MDFLLMGALCYRRKGCAGRKCVSHLFSSNRHGRLGSGAHSSVTLRLLFFNIQYHDDFSPAGVLVITAHEQSHDLASRAPAPTYACSPPRSQTSFIFKCHTNSCVESGYYIFSIRLSVPSDRLRVRVPSVSVYDPGFFSGL